MTTYNTEGHKAGGHILIASGAFKHSLSAADACAIIARGLRRGGWAGPLYEVPIADGGNGTLDAWMAQGGTRHRLTVMDPLMRPIEAEYGLLDDGRSAVIEMALASGLELLADAERDALAASTYGTGQLMQAALERGARRFIIGMGGSATVDGGAGALHALGLRLLNAQGEPLPGGGGPLHDLARIDASALDTRWADCEIIIASDVSNPVLGPEGAAAVFGPQKGASAEDVAILEASLGHFFALAEPVCGRDVRESPGAGAAGALAGGLLAFLGGRIVPGIDLLLEYTRFVDRLAGAALLITGEGRMDAQTIYGKGPLGVAQIARAHAVPSVALVGGLDVDDALLHEAGLNAVLPIVTQPMTLQQAIDHAATLLEQSALRLAYLLRLKA